MLTTDQGGDLEELWCRGYQHGARVRLQNSKFSFLAVGSRASYLTSYLTEPTDSLSVMEDNLPTYYEVSVSFT